MGVGLAKVVYAQSCHTSQDLDENENYQFLLPVAM